MTVSLQDIAERAGVSTMTVSRAIRGVNGVGDEMRQKIRDLANEMGYVPNQVASNLASRRTRTIGIVAPRLERFYPQVAMAIEDVLVDAGYYQLLCCSRDNTKREYDVVSDLLRRRVDGVVFASASMTKSRETVKLLKRQQVPVVLFNSAIENTDEDLIVFDDAGGACDAVTRMIEDGRRRLVHVGGPTGNWVAHERCRGYIEAMSNASLPVMDADIIRGGLSTEDGIAAAQSILRRRQLPNGIFCVNDLVAMGICTAFQEEGIPIPREVAITGFGQEMETDLLQMPIATVRQDAAELGRQAAYALLKRIEDPHFCKHPPLRQVLPVQHRECH